MVRRYKRDARPLRELNLGDLKPLDETIPELRVPDFCRNGGR